jgi:hypothetical protein
MANDDIDTAGLRQERRVDAQAQSRYQDLANRHSENRLTTDERQELEELVRRILNISVLKAAAEECFHQQAGS